MADKHQSLINGICEARFRKVREEFTENFETRHERGGAVAVWHNGQLVVDLWGGWSDLARTVCWSRDTILNVFSVSKAFCAIAIMRLVDLGLLDLDRHVSDYWPEFAQSGKGDVTVRQLMSHQAGLPAIRKSLPDGAALEWDVITSALAEQEPWWKPGTAHGYHVNTFGFLAGELVRRVSGRTVGTLVREEVAKPLGADIHIGLPRAEHHRVSDFRWPGNPVKPKIDGRCVDALEHLLEPTGLFRVALGQHGALARSRSPVDQWSRQCPRHRARLCGPCRWRHDRRHSDLEQRSAGSSHERASEWPGHHQPTAEPFRHWIPIDATRQTLGSPSRRFRALWRRRITWLLRSGSAHRIWLCHE